MLPNIYGSSLLRPHFFAGVFFRRPTSHGCVSFCVDIAFGTSCFACTPRNVFVYIQSSNSKCMTPSAKFGFSGKSLDSGGHVLEYFPCVAVIGTLTHHHPLG
ncbi:hypothetical protein M404DRAFT_476887 [Pisolithus tinctorius Marx 270]|uniref:Uncharacterized protein n=1 Tax=Pisolithus tinctorius Marx 270 TaxID=870435 RepID=A0A0C3PYS6_PISTI|nr:hypothetical protein M404DRAFT_476887 [Pisolithus tinctorius Marx 270]